MATINGTSANDVLAGSAADDVLAGLAGDDSLDGGGGANTYLFNPGDGNDTLEAQAAYGFADDILQLGAGFTIGNLRLIRPGDSDNLKITFTNSPTDSLTVYGHFQGAAFEFANVRFSDGSTLDIRTSGLNLPVYHQGMPYSDSLYGFDGVDILYGGDTNAPDELYGYGGNDTLDGQGGGDVMVGGNGDDTYYVDNADDVVSELAGQGTDLVYSSLSLDLSDEVENLVLTTTGNLNGTGNARNNRLTGNSGSNSLDGKTGADTLLGGAGDDRYYVDNAGDVVTELAGEGSDFVYSSLNAYTLANEVERLYLLGSTANGSGNGLDNLLTGNSAANILSGGGGLDTLSALAGNDTLDGGSGADKLYGGLGDDTYVVDDAGDVVSENAGEGVDIVLSSVTLTLKSNVEDLTLTGGANISAYGNTQDNRLTGNSGHNLLDGGQGSDTLSGGLGNDTYVLDVVTDVMVEAAGGGNDTVLAGWTYTLAGNFENLTLTGALAINGSGNGEVNVLTGNGAGNVLNGKAGADSMIGGLGDDRYYVDNAGDQAVETAGNGDDHVYSRVDFSLGLAVERLYLLEGTLARNATGNERNNILTGNSANNTFRGGVGDDLMIGAAGNDTYFYGRGGNADTIKENDATAGNTDVLVFQSGIAHDQLWFRRSGDSLIVNLLGSGEKVSVQGWFGSGNQVEVIRTEDGNRTLLAAQVQNLVTAMSSMAVPVTTTLTAAQHAVLDSVIAASWS